MGQKPKLLKITWEIIQECLGHFKQLSLFLSMSPKLGHLAHAQNVLKHIYFSFGIFEI